MMHITDDSEALLDYLYDEGDSAERLKIARHLQGCAACSVAVLELQSVRGLLSEWTPPAAKLGFKIVPEGAAGLEGAGSAATSRGWWRLGAGWPAWAQAAAAVFLFAAGLGVSQLQFEYGPGILTVRTGSASPLSEAAVQPVHSGSDVYLPAEPSRFTAASTASSSASAAADEVLRSVRALIDLSESRQQRELALRLAQVVRDFDTQRRADMQRVDENFGQLEGQTGAEVAQQRALLNTLVKVSQGGGK